MVRAMVTKGCCRTYATVKAFPRHKNDMNLDRKRSQYYRALYFDLVGRTYARNYLARRGFAGVA
jgi:hypothetical protein